MPKTLSHKLITILCPACHTSSERINALWKQRKEQLLSLQPPSIPRRYKQLLPLFFAQHFKAGIRIPRPAEGNWSYLSNIIIRKSSSSRGKSIEILLQKDSQSQLQQSFDLYINQKIPIWEEKINWEKERKALQPIRALSHQIITILSEFDRQLWPQPQQPRQSWVLPLQAFSDTVQQQITQLPSIQKRWKWLFDLSIENTFNSTQYPYLPVESELLPLGLQRWITEQKWTPDGYLAHGNNSDVLRYWQQHHFEKFDIIYTDPPYNTGSKHFHYRDGYSKIGWQVMIKERLKLCHQLCKTDAKIAISINESELFDLYQSMIACWGKENYASILTIKVRHPDRILKGGKDIHEITEQVLLFRNSPLSLFGSRSRLPKTKDEYSWTVQVGKPCMEQQIGGKKVVIYPPKEFSILTNTKSESQPLLKKINIRGSLREGNNSGRFYVRFIEPLRDTLGGHLFQVHGMGADGLGFRYFFLPTKNSFRKNGDYYQGRPLQNNSQIPYPNFADFELDFNRATYEGGTPFRNGKKALAFLDWILKIMNIDQQKEAFVVDIFGGGGSTAHAVMRCNRKDGGKRKFLLIEKEDYFDSILLPRILRAAYADKWGKKGPLDSKGIPIFLQILHFDTELKNAREKN